MEGVYGMINNFRDILHQMDCVFPVNECTIKSSEKNIYEGENQYLCMIIDKRFTNNVEIRIMKPYIWKDKKEELYGWFDKDNNYVDNWIKK